jgi:hypothetical protein
MPPDNEIGLNHDIAQVLGYVMKQNQKAFVTEIEMLRVIVSYSVDKKK